VIHAFYVPQFLFKRDVVPGKENEFDFTVDAADAGQTFRGQCAELCGTFHDAMQFTVHAMAPADYTAWLQKQIASAPPPAGSPPAGSPGAPPPSGPPGSAGPGGSAAAATLDLSARNIAFEQTSLTAPANVQFIVKFTNNDAGIPHNVVIHTGPNESDPAAFDGEIFSGIDTRLYPVPPLKPGIYAYSCKVHPSMTGTLTVQ
jgi:plastocyanin